MQRSTAGYGRIRLSTCSSAGWSTRTRVPLLGKRASRLGRLSRREGDEHRVGGAVGEEVRDGHAQEDGRGERQSERREDGEQEGAAPEHAPAEDHVRLAVQAADRHLVNSFMSSFLRRKPQIGTQTRAAGKERRCAFMFGLFGSNHAATLVLTASLSMPYSSLLIMPCPQH